MDDRPRPLFFTNSYDLFLYHEQKRKSVIFFKNRNGTFIRVLLQYKSKELFLNNVESFLTQIPLTTVLRAEGVFLAIRMQPSASISVLSDKKMTVHHCYLQIDCGSFFIFKMQILPSIELIA